MKRISFFFIVFFALATLFSVFSGFTIVSIKMEAGSSVPVKISYPLFGKTYFKESKYEGSGGFRNLNFIFFTGDCKKIKLHLEVPAEYRIKQVSLMNNPLIKFVFKRKEIERSFDVKGDSCSSHEADDGKVLALDIGGKGAVLSCKKKVDPQRKFSMLALLPIFFVLWVIVFLYFAGVWTRFGKYLASIPLPRAPKKVTPLNITIICASAFLLAMTCGLNPFGPENISVDSYVFLYLGDSLNHGFVPYRDVFDHKGPLIYFIDAYGLFVGNGAGIWIMEIIGLCLTMIFSYMGLRIWFRPFPSLCSTMLLSFLLYFFMDGGNFTEEYAVVFICLGFKIMSEYIKDNSSLKVMNCLLLGASAAAVIMLRMNMIPVFVTMAIAIIFYEVSCRRWLKLLKTICFGAAGLAAVILPFVIYFYRHDALNDFIDCYYFFNMAYRAGSTGILMGNAVHVFFQPYVILPLAVNIFFIWYYRKERLFIELFAGNILFFVISFFLLFFHNVFYAHYAMPFLPVLLLPVCAFVDLILKKWPRFIFFFLAAICAAICVQTWNAVYSLLAEKDNFNKYEQKIQSLILENQDQDIVPSILVFSNECRFYRKLNCRTKTRYPYLLPVMHYSERIRTDSLRNLAMGTDEFIIYNIDKNERPLSDFFGDVRKNYRQIGMTGPYIVYKYNHN